MIQDAIQIVVALIVGCWLGWRTCNSRWIDAARHTDKIEIGGEVYYPVRLKKWGEK